LEEHAQLRLCDPKALENARKELIGVQGVSFHEDPYEAAENVHAVALLTDWQCYRELDYAKVFDRMEKPAFLFDGRNLLDHRRLFEIGFNVYPVGKSPLRQL